MDSSFSLTRSLKSFERAWDVSPPASIDAHLEGAAGSRRLTLLQELVCIDMEFRWRNQSTSATQATQTLGSDSTIPAFLVDEYLARFPELGSSENVDPLLVEEEFRVRTQWGDRPDVAEFLMRFPQHAKALSGRLSAIQSDINPKPEHDAADDDSPGVAEFLERLAACGLHDSDSMLQVESQLTSQGTISNGRDAGDWLVSRKLLTSGQLNLLLKDTSCPLVLGSYEILDEVGAGGMGQVYKARHREMNRVVALKTLKSSLPATDDSTQRFQREVQAAARLVHPNVVVAHDAGEAGGVRYLVMEFVQGQDLNSLVREAGPLPVEEAVDCILQAAEGLKYAHQRGIIHRDVKPGNLLLDDEGVVKVLDLGLARFNEPDDGQVPDEAAPLTSAGMVMGTADYMAPEQASETRTADERADIYSLGCTLHFLLTGKRVFPEKTVWQTLSSHFNKPIPSLRKQCADLPQALDDAFQKMLAKKTAERFQTMQEVIDSLRGIDPAGLVGAAGTGNVAGTDSTIKTGITSEAFSESDATVVLDRKQSSSPDRRRLVAGSVELAAVVIVVVVGIVIWSGSSNSTVIDGGTLSAILGINPQPDPTSSETDKQPVGPDADLSSIAAQRDEALAALWTTENREDQKLLRAKVAELPSPLDSLRKEDIPQEMLHDATQYDKSGFLSDNLVAVLGNSATQHWNRILAVAFTNDSKRVISAGEDGTVVVRDAVTGDVLKRLVMDGAIISMAVTSDDENLIVQVGDKVAIEAWNLSSYERVWRRTMPDLISSLACSSDGRWLAVGANGVLHLLNRETNAWKIHPLEGNCGAMAFCGDNRWLAIGHGSWKPGISIFDLNDFVFADPLDVEFCNSLEASADGERLFANDTEFLTVWNVSDWSLASRVKLKASFAMALRHDGNELATLLSDAQGASRGIRVVDAATGATIGTFDYPGFLNVWSLDFSNDGSRFAAGSGHGLYVWDNASKKRVLYSGSDHQGTIEKLAVHPDSSILATADSLRRISQWKMATAELLSTARVAASGKDPPAVADLKFSPDGTHLAVAGAELALRYLVPESGKLYRQFSISEPAKSLSFSPDSSRLYTTHLSGNCVERDAGTSEVQRTFHVSEGAVRKISADVSRDGKWLASGWEIIGGRGLQIVDVQTGKPAETLRDGLASLAFTPDQQSIFTGSDQKFILAPQSDQTTEMSLPGDPRAGRGTFRLSEYAVAVNPLTGELVGASNTGVLHFWTPSGTPLRTVFIGPPGGRISDLEFTPDGRYLLTANGNGTIYVLRVARNLN